MSAFGIMCDMMHMEGSASVITQLPSRSMTCRLIYSLDAPGDGGTVGDAVCFPGVLGVLCAGGFSGGGIVDGVTGIDVSSGALLAFFFTLNRSRLGSKTNETKNYVELTDIRIKNNTICPFRYLLVVLQ